MLVKLVDDIVKTQTVTCGEADMVLGSADYSKPKVAICPYIKPIIAHYHPGFDDILRPRRLDSHQEVRYEDSEGRRAAPGAR